MMASVIFVPVDGIVEPFEQLADTSLAEAQPITGYFEDTYIGRQRRRGRRGPPFGEATWCVHGSAGRGPLHTNRHSESWHRRL